MVIYTSETFCVIDHTQKIIIKIGQLMHALKN